MSTALNKKGPKAALFITYLITCQLLATLKQVVPSLSLKDKSRTEPSFFKTSHVLIPSANLTRTILFFLLNISISCVVELSLNKKRARGRPFIRISYSTTVSRCSPSAGVHAYIIFSLPGSDTPVGSEYEHMHSYPLGSIPLHILARNDLPTTGG